MQPEASYPAEAKPVARLSRAVIAGKVWEGGAHAFPTSPYRAHGQHRERAFSALGRQFDRVRPFVKRLMSTHASAPEVSSERTAWRVTGGSRA